MNAPRLLNNRNIDLPRSLFSDLQLDKLLSSQAIAVLQHPCEPDEIMRRNELFLLLDKCENAARLESALSALCATERALLLYKDAKIPLDTYHRQAEVLEAYIASCEALASMCGMGSLFADVADYFSSEKMQKLLSEMKEKAVLLEFEAAAEIKKKYELIENFRTRSEVVSPIISNVDVFSIESDEKSAFINFLHITNGCINQAFTIEYKKRLDESNEELLTMGIVEMRERFKSHAREIILPVNIELPLEGVSVTVPMKGEKKRLLALSQLNVKQYKADRMKMEEKLISPAGETCFQPQVSPDGKSIAYLKDRTAIAVMDIKSGDEKIVLDKSVNYSYQDGDQNFAWSPDSQYILCNYQANGGWNNEDVALINVESGEITDLTESGYTDGNFKWVLGGKAMTWMSDKAGYRSHGSWGAEDDIYIMFFDGQRYAEFQKDKEDRTIAELLKTDKEDKKEKKDSAKAEKRTEKLVLDLENRKDRIVRLTNYSGRIGDYHLTKDGKKLYYSIRLERSTDLCVLNLEDKSIKVVAKGISGSIYPTEDDKYMYMLSGGSVSRIATANGSREIISFSGNFEYKPAAEREYIFDHIWKQVQEKFYMPDLHGTDWDGHYTNYKRFLPHIDNNFDFQEMLSELLGELNGSHTGARYQYKSGLNTASLGIFHDQDYEGDGIRIKEVIKGGTLFIADPEIKEGDIITSINGKEIKAGMDWYTLLRMQGGKKMAITIKKDGKKEVEMYIEPAYTDAVQLYKRWVQQRADMVEKLSGGKVGYVHVQDMDSESFREVYSDLLGKYRTCEAVIVDTRHNGGGWLHDDLATLLSGKGYIRFEPRGQYIGTEPYNKWTKPSCVLMGEDNYSDACGFPYTYRALGIGKLIGAPVPGTMTAVWWENQIDNNIVFGIPQVGALGVKEGRYLENMQIEPDILVYNDPASVLRGEDKQLEAAVAEMMKTIQK